MPIRSSLTLDIADFEAGLDAAEVDLQTFAKAARNVNKDLAKLAEGFSGEKIAAEAARTVKVIDDLGGVSKLTEKEMSRVNATVNDAIAKYEALGETAPQSMIDLAAATNQTTLSMTHVAAGAAVAGAAILAVAEAARRGFMAAIDYAGGLTDVAAATGITTTDLQVLERVTAGTPANLESIAKASTELSKALLTDKGARAAIQAMGLSLDELLAGNPADGILEVGAAIAAIENPAERATAGGIIFGKTWKDLAPAVTTDMAAMGAEIRKTGDYLSEDLVAGGDAAGDALEALEKTGFRLMAETLLPLAPAIQALAEWLGQNLPPAVDAGKRAVFAMVEAWLELRLSVQQTAADILQATRDIPLLGKAFGASGASVEYFQGLADDTRKYLVALRLTGVEPLATAVTKATPPLSAYGRGLGAAADGAAKATKGLSFVDGEINGLTLAMIQGIVTLDQWGVEVASMGDDAQAAADQLARLGGEVIKIGPALENTFKTNPLIPFRTAMAEADTAIPGFFGNLKHAFTDAGLTAESLGQTFAAAFTGGGGALGAIQSFATQGLQAVMSMIPLVGPFVSQFAGPIIAMLGKLTSKFKDLFGGVSAEEKAARASVAAFEAELSGLLTSTQKVEAGNEAWKQTVVAVRDAYIAAGHTEAEALAAVEALWESSQEGAAATEAAIEAIRTVMASVGAETADFAAQVTDAIESIPNEVTIDVRGEYHAPDIGGDVPGYQHGSGGVQDFGAGTLAMLHGREAVVTEAQLAAAKRMNALPAAPRPAARAAGPTIVVNAQGAFLGDLASQMRLRRLVSDALVSEAELRTGLAPAGGF